MSHAAIARHALGGVACLVLVAAMTGAQSGHRSGMDLDGAWRGTSICTAAGRPACHDETVVYRIRSAAPGSDSLTLVMNKVVAGREEAMGTVTCAVVRRDDTLVCPMREWRWTFAAGRDRLVGTLANREGVVWRHVRVRRTASAVVRAR